MEVSSLLIKMSNNLHEQQFTINEQTKLHNKENERTKLIAQKSDQSLEI